MGSGGTRTRTLASRTHLVVACLLALTFAALAAPRPALADTGGWASHPWPGCLGGTNSGGWDDSGLVYVPCGNPSVIAVYDESAHLVRTIPTGRFVTDAAPTRDGAFLYLAGPAGLTRMARQPTGSYAPDTAWHPDSFQMWGSTWQPQGHYVATDSAGNVYLADGTWTQNIAHTVIKYDPAGHVVTRFGEWANSWGTGTFYWALAGLAVSGDGATVYTVEIGNNRIQRWTRQGSGAYTATSTFGSNEANNPTREGFCDYAGWRGTLAAPYDIALDGAGNVYVINTTCKQVLSWTPDLSALRLNADVRVAGGDYPRPHGFTVGRDGTVYVGENQRMLRPAGGALPSDGLPPAAGSVGGTGSDGGQTGTGSGSAGSASPGNSSASTGDDDQARAATGADPLMVTPRPARPPQQGAAPADRTAPRVKIGRVQALRRALRTPVRCSETCRVLVVARQGGRLVGRRVMWLRADRTLPVAARITLRARAGRVALQLVVRDRAGNAVSYRRAGSIAGRSS